MIEPADSGPRFSRDGRGERIDFGKVISRMKSSNETMLGRYKDSHFGSFISSIQPRHILIYLGYIQDMAISRRYKQGSEGNKLNIYLNIN
jgi:hypothetical protein